MQKILLTGAAGFIGYHVAKSLLRRGDQVVGVDCLNDYYDVQLKLDRLHNLQREPGFEFRKIDIADRTQCWQLMKEDHWDVVIHLAAQVGVRHSVEDPMAFVDTNLAGFMNVLEGAKESNAKHFVYASSSSVYGANQEMPFSVKDPVDHPISLYAATKRANELFAHSYSDLFGLPTTGLRFFTVYGPWGRPDMAVYRFTKSIQNCEPIAVYNHGKMKRDFTYVGDVATAIVRVADRPPETNKDSNDLQRHPGASTAPFKVYNVGNHTPIELMHLIGVIESRLGIKAKIDFQPMQPGDVPATYADVSSLMLDAEFHPSTSIEEGISRFVNWYRDYHAIKSVPVPA